MTYWLLVSPYFSSLVTRQPNNRASSFRAFSGVEDCILPGAIIVVIIVVVVADRLRRLLLRHVPRLPRRPVVGLLDRLNELLHGVRFGIAPGVHRRHLGDVQAVSYTHLR